MQIAKGSEVMTNPKFVRKRIQIRTFNALMNTVIPLEIDALVLGVWAAHYALDGWGVGATPSVDNWVVSHVPTGFRVPENAMSESKAAKLARALYHSYPNWYEHLKRGENRRGEPEWQALGKWLQKWDARHNE